MSNKLILITGDDEELIRKKTSEAIKEIAGEQPDEFSLDIIKENDETSDIDLITDLIRSIQTPSFFGAKTICLANSEVLAKEGAKTDNSPLANSIRTLAELIENGLPNDISLILSGIGIDSRKALFKACKSQNATIFTFKKLQLGDNKWQEQISQHIRQQAKERGLILPHNAIEYLTEVIGTDTGRIANELEKIACATFGKSQIALNDITDICVGNASTAFWAFSNALGERDLKQSMQAIDGILQEIKDIDSTVMGLLMQTAKFFKLLLHGKIFMQAANLTSPQMVQNFMNELKESDKEKFKENEFVKIHPYRAFNLAKMIVKFNGRELVNALNLITKMNRKVVSSPLPRRLLLEQLAFGIIKGNRQVL